MVDRVLVVGYGSIGQRHVRTVRAALPNADICVLRRALNEPPAEFVSAIYTQLQDALVFEPQLAVVACPASEHLKVATALVAQGCHVLIEKPLCMPNEKDSDFVSACKANPGVHVQVGYNLRFLSSLGRFRQLIREGTLGRVLSVRCEVGQYLPDWRPGRNYRNSVSAQRVLGGGVLMELSHELDYLQWVFGRCEWISAYLGRHSALDIDVEDTAQLFMGHASQDGGGSVVTTLAMDFYRRDTTRRCTAICEQGTASWDAIAGRVELFKAGSSATDLVLQADLSVRDTYALQWENFTQLAYGLKPKPADLCNARNVMTVISAARQSADANSVRVDVPAAGEW